MLYGQQMPYRRQQNPRIHGLEEARTRARKVPDNQCRLVTNSAQPAWPDRGIMEAAAAPSIAGRARTRGDLAGHPRLTNSPSVQTLVQRTSMAYLLPSPCGVLSRLMHCDLIAG